jgi:intein-encoded DNA endonuclease-like protein
MLPESPDSIIGSLRHIMAESAKGVDALYAAEVKLAEVELEYDSEYQRKFIDAGGTVADRQAVAKLQTADLKFQVDVARAELNRVKVKIKQLSDAGTLTAVMAKQIELTWKHA